MKLTRTLLSLSAVVFLGACQAPQNNSDETTTAQVTQTSSVAVAEVDKVKGERIDAEVVIETNQPFAKMSATEKSEQFQKLDEIIVNTKTEVDMTQLTAIQEIVSDKDYFKLIEQSQEDAQVIYLGFNECPYCKAFSPKLNALATEKDVVIHYYNTHKHSKDTTFTEITQFYQVETVPHAFIVHKGQIVGIINHESTMESMEQFVEKVVTLNQ